MEMPTAQAAGRLETRSAFTVFSSKTQKYHLSYLFTIVPPFLVGSGFISPAKRPSLGPVDWKNHSLTVFLNSFLQIIV